MKDYSMLNQKMREAGFKKKTLAHAINLGYKPLCKRLRGRLDFKAEEINCIAVALSLSHEEVQEYFFSNKNRENHGTEDTQP